MLSMDLRGSVLYLTLDRPDVRNAFNDELIEALTAAFTSLSSGVRAVVLGANGSAFCGGGDLNWMRKAAAYTEEENIRDAMNLAGLFDSIVRCPAVVISRVHGPAFGGGCGLVAASDVAIAATAAKFSFSEVKLGLIPATISPFVVDKIGKGHSRALFSTGEVFDAARAYTIGLVHDVVEAGEIDARIGRCLDAVLAAGPQAVAESKRLAIESPLEMAESARRLATARAGAEGREGVTAFLEKRPASFVEARS